MYDLNNIILNNIISNSIALFHIEYNDIILRNIDVNHIYCIGEGGETSFINFDGGETKRNFVIDNLNAKYIISNGSFIKIKGDYNEVVIKNSNIQKVNSFGSILEYKGGKRSTVDFNNVNFSENENTDKFDCGCIRFKKYVDLTISNSTFYNNHCKSNGGAICINKYNGLKLNIKSNIFTNNHAINGGAIYLEDDFKNNNDDGKENVIFENNIFYGNNAEEFGGAIYSNYQNLYNETAINNTISYNIANIMGGGIFAESWFDKNQFNVNNNKIFNNTVNSYINNYTSKPSYISLDTKISFPKELSTGDLLPLTFSLHDQYGNIMEDITKYYSSLSIKIELQQKYDEDDEYYYDDEYNNYINSNKEKYKLYGNVGTFIMGKCEMNNFRIYANPNIYYMNVIIENFENNHIELRFNNIEIKVNGCDSNQIKMYDKNGILYCESPKCKSNCPILTSASCEAPAKNFEKINDINLNKCVCNPGWLGSYCDIKNYVDLR
ncbi:hypothetical protein PIROE2DRAFT_13300 [Piromyces sp. E2]|nr:hypothetical protein PIROE2DRAFT_13300 [Piromyces sp. E2]|eukprot:OUM60857.1 hypothetical protein PIROE2DRAFT_13300 [Piromyces sp. E2]